MVRIVKEHDERLNELLDTAQQLFFRQGYEKTSVNHIIDKVGVAKGTFYHYFKSKADLLDRLVMRFTEKSLGDVRKIIEKKDMDAVDKMNRFFLTIRDSKVENIELMKMLMRVMYRDENLIFRYKIFRRTTELLVPEFAKIIRQGIEEGCFSTADAKETAELVFILSYNLNEIVVGLLLEVDQKPGNLDRIEQKLKTWERSIERVLGVSEGTLEVVDRKHIEMFRLEGKGARDSSGGGSR